NVDLSKLQMLCFTFVAVTIYLIQLLTQSASPPELVDIPPALMVLMGLSQGAYLGQKLVTTQTPRITGLTPAAGGPGTSVTLRGVSSGASQGGSVLAVDGRPVLNITSWSDAAVQFDWPAERGRSLPWKDGDLASISVVVNGREAPNAAVFGVT